MATYENRVVYKLTWSNIRVQHPDQGIGQQILTPFNVNTIIAERGVGETLLVTPFLNGLHYSYAWAKALNF